MSNEEVLLKFKEEIKLRGLSPHTEEEYFGALQAFLRHYENRPLETMGETEIRGFLLYQIDLGKSTGSVNIYNSALRFIFGAVMQLNLNCRLIPRRRYRREFPAIMSKDELILFFDVIDNLRDRAIFETIYGAGLRVSEIVRLRVQDIDSKQMRIFIHQGKGGKDRYTLLSQRNLELLREYWKEYRPTHPDGYLFYSKSRKNNGMTTRSISNAFRKYRQLANLPNSFTTHTLRHCFATHLLESGVDVCCIKELLGHTFVQTTSFYLHMQNMNDSVKSPLDTLHKKRGRKSKVKGHA